MRMEDVKPLINTMTESDILDCLETIAEDHALHAEHAKSFAVQWLDSAHGDDMGNFSIEELKQEFTDWLDEQEY